MKTINYYLKMIVTIISLHMFLSCSNNPGGTLIEAPNLVLPPETQTGANTFGCLINGKLLVPRDGTGTIGSSDKGARFWGGYPLETDYYEIDVRDYKSDKQARLLLHVHAAHFNGVGNYIVDNSNGSRGIDGLSHNYLHCMIFNNATNSYQFYRSFNNSGNVTITRYDFANRIISGVFSCKVRNSTNQNDEIEITQGRFDIKWDILPDKIYP